MSLVFCNIDKPARLVQTKCEARLISLGKNHIVPPMLCKRILAFTLAFCLSQFACLLHAQADCTNWPQVFSTNKASQSITVRPFELQNTSSAYNWLKNGLSYFLSDLFESAAGVSVVPSAENATYIVQGTVQQLEKNLRFFVSVSREGEVLKYYELLVTPPLQRTLFLRLSELTRDMLKDLKLERDESVFNAIRNSVSSAEAYQAYTYGREALLSFESSKFEQAAKWFSESKRLDFRSALGFAGSFETAILQAFEAKQAQKPARVFIDKAEQEIKLIEKYKITIPSSLFLLANNNVQSDKDGKSMNRFLHGQASFIEALSAYQRGDLRLAEGALQKLVLAVPEDGLAWHFLGKTQQGLQQQAAAQKSFAKARELNHCLPAETL